MTGLHAVVAVLCVYRVTLLVTADEITAPLRDRLVRWLNERKHRRPPLPSYTATPDQQATFGVALAVWEQRVATDPHRLAFLVGCPWCASPYVALAVVAATLAWADSAGWWLVCGTLAASGVTGALASKASP